ncbi:MAG: hypothetical protein E3K32_11810 [wastewater metagenome]|nr:hypothetical protein [Candidatus Loosdrechtia aerotolerans]
MRELTTFGGLLLNTLHGIVVYPGHPAFGIYLMTIHGITLSCRNESLSSGMRPFAPLRVTEYRVPSLKPFIPLQMKRQQGICHSERQRRISSFHGVKRAS